MMKRLRTVIHQECQLPQTPYLLALGRTGGNTATSRFLPTWMSLIPCFQVRPLSQRLTTRPWYRSLQHCKMEPSPQPGLATPFRGKRLRKTQGRLLPEPVPETSSYGHTDRPH